MKNFKLTLLPCMKLLFLWKMLYCDAVCCSRDQFRDLRQLLNANSRIPKQLLNMYNTGSIPIPIPGNYRDVSSQYGNHGSRHGHRLPHSFPSNFPPMSVFGNMQSLTSVDFNPRKKHKHCKKHKKHIEDNMLQRQPLHTSLNLRIGADAVRLLRDRFNEGVASASDFEIILQALNDNGRHPSAHNNNKENIHCSLSKNGIGCQSKHKHHHSRHREKLMPFPYFAKKQAGQSTPGAGFDLDFDNSLPLAFK